MCVHAWVHVSICICYTYFYTLTSCIAVSFTADTINLSMITFKAAAQQLPVVLRQWFITLDRKAASLVEEYVLYSIFIFLACSVNRFTKRYITPLLWRDQLASFEASPRTFDNMEVCHKAKYSTVYNI